MGISKIDLLKLLAFFVFIKIIFFFSSYFLGVRIDQLGGLNFVYKIFAVLVIIIVIGFVVKKVNPSMMKYVWMVILFLMIGSYFVNRTYFFIGMISLMFYALVYSESKLYDVTAYKIGNGRLILIVSSALPLLINLLFENGAFVTSNSIFIVQTLFSYVSSYYVKKGEEIVYGSLPTLIFGIAMAGASVLFAYYLGIGAETSLKEYLLLFLFVGGNFIVNMNLYERVKKFN